MDWKDPKVLAVIAIIIILALLWYFKVWPFA